MQSNSSNKTEQKIKYDSWATLNEEGKKEWSDIFPTGEVPIVSIVGIWMQTDANAKPESAYLIRQEDLSPEQLDKLLTKLSEKFKASKEVIKQEMEKNRIPLRAKLTNGAGTTKIGMFLPDDLCEDEEDNYGFADEDEEYYGEDLNEEFGF